MTKRFCDVCERPLSPEDDKPFIRQLSSPNAKVVITLMTTNEYLHAVNDVCNKCKIKVVNEGTPYTAPPIATLQSKIETPPTTPPIKLFSEGTFVPSKPNPATQPKPEQPKEA